MAINTLNELIRDINSSINKNKREILDALIGLTTLSYPSPVGMLKPVRDSLESMRKNKLFFSDILSNKQNAVTKGTDVLVAQLERALAQLDKKLDSFIPVITYLVQALPYLEEDMGFFHGKMARDAFDEVIASAMFQSKKNITFGEHFKYFLKKLVVTGSNLTTGKTVFFSVDETPDFPVADAVRISMSLPFIFKPYVLNESKKGWPPCGVYVDGGLFNNSPLHAFDDEIWEKQEEAQRNNYSLPLSRAIGIRLQYDSLPYLPVRSSPLNFYYPFLSTIIMNGIFGTGESQVLAREANRYIVLDSEPLSLLGFDPPADDTVLKRSRREVYRYFGLEPELRDKDDKDDKESAERKQKASNPCSA